jgi:hypothetical protein
VNQLVKIRDAAAKLGRYDSPDLEEEDIIVIYSPEEKEEFRKQIREAQAGLWKEIQRDVFLLSTRAIDLLQRYVLKAEQPDREEDYPDARAFQLVRDAHQEFYDIAQHDLGVPGLWLVRRKAGSAAVWGRLDRLWWPWTPERIAINAESEELRRASIARRKQQGRMLPVQPFATKFKKWLIENFSIRP